MSAANAFTHHAFRFTGGSSATCTNCGLAVFAEIRIKGSRARAVLRANSNRGKSVTPSQIRCKR